MVQIPFQLCACNSVFGVVSMAGVHITPVQVAGNNGAGVSVTVNSCIPPGSSMAQSQSGP